MSGTEVFLESNTFEVLNDAGELSILVKLPFSKYLTLGLFCRRDKKRFPMTKKAENGCHASIATIQVEFTPKVLFLS